MELSNSSLLDDEQIFGDVDDDPLKTLIDENEDTISTEHHTTKCGEIYISSDASNLNFFCTLCSDVFLNFNYFLQHLLNIHQIIILDSPGSATPTILSNKIIDLNFINNDQTLSPTKKYLNSSPPRTTLNESIDDIESNFSLILNNTPIYQDGSYKCEICSRSFASYKHAQNHMVKCSQKEYAFSCKKCARRFLFEDNFIKHTELIECSIDTPEKKSKPISVQPIAGVKPYKCLICNKGFLNTIGVNRHRQHCEKLDIPFACAFCPRKFYDENKLKKHENSKHFTELNPDIPKGYWKCGICKKFFSNSYCRKRHNELHSNDVSKNICNICGQSLSSPNALTVHRKSHTDERNLKCPFCPKTFKYPTSLKHHELSHTQERNFQCSFCDKKFLTKAHKNNHETLHNNEKKFKCSKCDKSFHRKDYLESHAKIHLEKKKLRPYLCEEKNCKSSFSSLKYLKVHQRLHENGIIYKCKYCDKQSLVKSFILNHEKIHLKPNEVYYCAICSTKFIKKSNLKRHLAIKHINSNLNEFKCDQCSKQFDNKIDFQTHITKICRIKVKKYACDMCNARFIAEINLKLHKSAYHKNIIISAI